jgi:hypothetical protein
VFGVFPEVEARWSTFFASACGRRLLQRPSYRSDHANRTADPGAVRDVDAGAGEPHRTRIPDSYGLAALDADACAHIRDRDASRLFHSDPDAHGDGNVPLLGNGDAPRGSDADRDSDGDAVLDSDRHSDQHAHDHSHADRDADRDVHSSDIHLHVHTISNLHALSNLDVYLDTDTDTDADADRDVDARPTHRDSDGDGDADANDRSRYADSDSHGHAGAADRYTDADGYTGTYGYTDSDPDSLSGLSRR